MDPNRLPRLPGVSPQMISAWLRDVHRASEGHPVAPQEFLHLLEASAPPSLAQTPENSGDLLRWLEDTQMVARGPDSIGLSVKGLVFATQDDTPRLTPPQAWAKVQDFMARVEAHNLEGGQPKILDVLLFGSMQDPSGASFGDADLMLILDDAKDLDVPNLLKTLQADDKFLSIEPYGFFAHQLGRQDPEFCMVSLTGTAWTAEAMGVVKTVDATAVLAALDNAPRKIKSHVSKSMGLPPPQGFLDRLFSRRAPAMASEELHHKTSYKA